jgi:hypothetical protein
MSEQDPLEQVSPVLRPLVEAVTKAMAEAFDEVWTRPDAPALMEAFLDGRCLFQVDRHGVLILDRAGESSVN